MQELRRAARAARRRGDLRQGLFHLQPARLLALGRHARASVRTAAPIYRAALAHRFNRHDGTCAQARQPRHGELSRSAADAGGVPSACSTSRRSLELQRGHGAAGVLARLGHVAARATQWARARVAARRRAVALARRQGREPADRARGVVARAAGRCRSSAARPKSTPTTNAWSSSAASRSTRAACTSASPVTTCSTSRSAWCCAQRTGSSPSCRFELLEGMADPLRRALQRVSDDVLVYCPIVDAGVDADRDRVPDAPPRREHRRGEFPAPQLRHARRRRRVRARARALRARRSARCASFDAIGAAPQARPRAAAGRCARRRRAFDNEPDTDFALPQNRAWHRRAARALAHAARASTCR